ncbi:MAG TPA: hypothetical protein VEG44_10375 [Candidatus Acidoferrales bacterium]|nr:hypothetical protein [Candidatus Acidoferrales bacterium]
MVPLIFCDITIDLIALATAIATGFAVNWTLGGAVISLVGDTIVTVGAVPALIGAIIPVIPAALLFLSAFGITFPVVFHI